MTPALLGRVETGTGADLLARLFAVLLPDATTVLDATWGHGGFWKPAPSGLVVTGLDRSAHGRPAVVGDFTRLPFADGAFDGVVFDPPYLTDTGRESLVARRFGSYPSIPELRLAVRAGVGEAWRVGRIGIVVKVQDYVHASRLVRMTRWVEDAVPADLYDVVYLASRSKPEDGKWARVGGQLSVRSTATTWLVFRKDGPIHKRRQPAPEVAARRTG